MISVCYFWFHDWLEFRNFDQIFDFVIEWLNYTVLFGILMDCITIAPHKCLFLCSVFARVFVFVFCFRFVAFLFVYFVHLLILLKHCAYIFFLCAH